METALKKNTNVYTTFLILDIGPMLINGQTGMGPVGANTLTCYASTCHNIHFDRFQSAETQKHFIFGLFSIFFMINTNKTHVDPTYFDKDEA